MLFFVSVLVPWCFCTVLVSRCVCTAWATDISLKDIRATQQVPLLIYVCVRVHQVYHKASGNAVTVVNICCETPGFTTNQLTLELIMKEAISKMHASTETKGMSYPIDEHCL